MTQQLSEIVRVTATISAAGTPRATLGRGLYLTRDRTVLDVSGAEKVKSYNGLSEVADDFASSLDPYLAAQRWFGQSPYPNKLLVGRWVNQDQRAEVRGGDVSTLLATFAAISDGSFSVKGIDFTGVNLQDTDSAQGGAQPVTDLAGVATAVQAALRGNGDAALAGATVTYDEAVEKFRVEFSSIAADAGAVFAAETNGNGTDLSALMALTTETGAVYHPGASEETVADALDAIRDVDPSFVFVTIDPALNGTQAMLDVSAWVAANPCIFCAESNEPEALTTGEGTSFAARLAAVQSSRTLLTWSAARDYKAVSIAARLSSVNFAVPGSLITAAFKQLPGTTPDDITSAQRAELERKRVNYYTRVGGTNVYLEGWTLKPGVWVDVVYWIDWITDAIKTAVFNLLTSSRRVPQTVDGIAAIREVIVAVCEEGVRNGGIAPGTVSPAMAARIAQVTGVDSFNGELPNGYLVYIGSLADQAPSERTARVAPAINVWLKGSGAVHSVDIDLTFEN